MTGRLPSVVSIDNVWRLATSSCLVVGPWVADAVIVVGRYDGNDLIVWVRLMTWGTNGSPWLPAIAFLVVSALFAARSMAACVLVAIVIANVGVVECSACKVAARVF